MLQHCVLFRTLEENVSTTTQAGPVPPAMPLLKPGLVGFGAAAAVGLYFLSKKKTTTDTKSKRQLEPRYNTGYVAEDAKVYKNEEGYFVLKETELKGINPFEKVRH